MDLLLQYFVRLEVDGVDIEWLTSKPYLRREIYNL